MIAYKSTFPSTPFTTAGSHEPDESERRTIFGPLIHVLLAARECGITLPSCSKIAMSLVHSDNQVYQRTGVSTFHSRVRLRRWRRRMDCIAPKLVRVDGVTTAHDYSRLLLSSQIDSRLPRPTEKRQSSPGYTHRPRSHDKQQMDEKS